MIAAMAQLLSVCIGGAVGSGLRFLLARWSEAALGTAFPWGTLLVNLVGSFAIALLAAVGDATGRIPPLAQLTLTTGVLGGFTTFSAFSQETLRCLQREAPGLAALNVAANVAGGLAAAALGWAVGRLAVRP